MSSSTLANVPDHLAVGCAPLTLDCLGVGLPARVERVAVEGGRGLHLMEMGLTPGTRVAVARVAPFGDPIDILVRGYHLSLRRAEARRVTVLGTTPEGVSR